MDTNTRLAVIKENLYGTGRQYITSNDVVWLVNTVVEQQKEIETLKGQLNTKITFINNGWEEERYILQEKVKRYETALQSIAFDSKVKFYERSPDIAKGALGIVVNERKYFVVMEGEDPIVVTVKDDVNRPNNPNCDDVLDDYMTENFGLKVNYEYYEIDTCEQVGL